MDTIQKQIISLLRSKKKPLHVGYLESQLSANKTRILTAIDELSLNYFVDVTRSSGGTIKRVRKLGMRSLLSTLQKITRQTYKNK